MNLAVALYIAYWFGMHADADADRRRHRRRGDRRRWARSACPAQVSFITSIAPICIAMGVPIEPLGLFVAVETLPDLFRTRRQCRMDVAATALLARRIRLRRRRRDRQRLLREGA